MVFFKRAQFCTSRTWILFYFLSSGHHWLPRDAFPPTTLFELNEQLLHRPIFDRVKADDSDSSARREEFPRGPNSFLQGAEFVIDSNAKRLKRTCRRVNPAARVGGWYRSLYDFGKLTRRLDRLHRTSLHDCLCDATRIALFSPPINDVG